MLLTHTDLLLTRISRFVLVHLNKRTRVTFAADSIVSRNNFYLARFRLFVLAFRDSLSLSVSLCTDFIQALDQP